MQINPILSSELDVHLSEEEVSLLENKTICGQVQMREREGNTLNVRSIEVLRGQIPDEQLFLNLETFPEGAGFEEVNRYRIVVSNEGYQMLLSRMYVCDRIGLARVNLYKDGKA